MRRTLRLVLLGLAAATALPAFAGPATDTLGTCLVDKTNGRDRKDLMRWFVVAIAAHPEIKASFVMSPKDRDDADRQAAALFTRLIAVDCADEMRAAYKADGTLAVKTAFGKLGQAAIQELMSDPAVQDSMNSMNKYIDRSAMEKVMGPK